MPQLCFFWEMGNELIILIYISAFPSHSKMSESMVPTMQPLLGYQSFLQSDINPCINTLGWLLYQLRAYPTSLDPACVFPLYF